MNNTNKKAREVDIEVYFGVQPPILTPVSIVAQEYFCLPEGVRGIVIEGECEEVMASLPEDFLVGATNVFTGKFVVGGLTSLH